MTPSSAALRRRVRERRRTAERTILDATEALLTDREFRDLTVEDVMASTGLTRTSFYRYFPDLEAVLLRWLADLGDELRRTADSWLQDPSTGLETGVEFVTLYRDHGRLLLAFEQASGAGTEIDEAWGSVIQAFTDSYTEFIAELCRQGACSHRGPEQTARALVGMTERYLLDTYGRGPAVDVGRGGGHPGGIWQRTLFSFGNREAVPSRVGPTTRVHATEPDALTDARSGTGTARHLRSLHSAGVRPEDSIRVGRITRVLNEFVRPRRLGPSIAVDVAAYHVHGEPVPAAEAFAADYRPFALGGSWGPPWDTTWFRLRGTVPSSGPDGRWPWASAIGNAGSTGFGAEALVWRDGRPVQGLSPNHREYLLTTGAAGGEDDRAVRGGGGQSAVPVRRQPVAAPAARARRCSPVHAATRRPPCAGSGVRASSGTTSGSWSSC